MLANKSSVTELGITESAFCKPLNTSPKLYGFVELMLDGFDAWLDNALLPDKLLPELLAMFPRDEPNKLLLVAVLVDGPPNKPLGADGLLLLKSPPLVAFELFRFPNKPPAFALDELLNNPPVLVAFDADCPNNPPVLVAFDDGLPNPVELVSFVDELPNKLPPLGPLEEPLIDLVLENPVDDPQLLLVPPEPLDPLCRVEPNIKWIIIKSQ